MGSVSSVYVNPVGADRSLNESETATPEQGNDTVEVIRDRPQPERSAVELRLHHTFAVSEDKTARESDMSRTIQYLAEENARLALANRDLTLKLQELSQERDRGPAGGPDIRIYGETAEERLSRLEKTLEAERMDKWKAIEDCEWTRVELVNCERDLSNKSNDVARLQKELDEARKSLSQLEDRLRQSEPRRTPERQERLRKKLEEVEADVAVKREMRQAAIAAVSSEMNRLREELEAERGLRRSLQEQLDGGDEERTTKSDAEKIRALRSENDRLRGETRTYQREVRALESAVTRLKSDVIEERRRHEETSRLKRAAEEQRAQAMREMDEERERIWADYDREKVEVNKKTTALKEVIEISRQMLVIRDNQVQELKRKLREIEESVNNSKLPDQCGLRAEYEKQLQNIKSLRELYEERVRLMELERDKLNEKITEHAKTIEGQKGEIESLQEKCGTAAEELKREKSENDSLQRDLRLSIATSKDFENELTLINNLFTQMLLGNETTDLDKLTDLLQENHDLITQLTLRESSSEIASVLPKLLLDLITQVDGDGQARDQDLSEADTVSEQSDTIAEDAVLPILSYKRAVVFEDPAEETTTAATTPEDDRTEETSKPSEELNSPIKEIASNLPKVWRVLTELLSHHTVPDGPPPGDEKLCYKNIETPSGTRSVISVSNTFIRLKDLILEKKALQKELVRLKQLNSHLETRLDDQEKRLSHVQCELHKTWGIVGRMRAQHQQLHNHERILRYELQEKRVMLSELKQELEYCRDKWEKARQKNDESETQWQKLRREFAARKNKGRLTPSLNDSGESGFSDEPNESSEEADNFDADRSSTQSPIEGKMADGVLTDTGKEVLGHVEVTREDVSETISEPEGSGRVSPVVEQSSDAGERLAQSEEIPTTVQPTDVGERLAQREEPPATEERLRRREERLKRLEDQCQVLVRKVDVTTSKSNFLNNRLEELHEQYGEASAPAAATEPVEPARSVEEILNARSERLKRLEEQCQSLVGKVANTVQRGTEMSNKLEDLHVEFLNSSERSGGGGGGLSGNGEAEEGDARALAVGSGTSAGALSAAASETTATSESPATVWSTKTEPTTDDDDADRK